MKIAADCDAAYVGRNQDGHRNRRSQVDRLGGNPGVALGGGSKVSKAIAWARRNWRTVKRWLDAGLSFATIMELILRALGLA
ncbi:aureocin A53 family class IId bacteriocin [Isoptericola sp. G70]|uniref:aureocin A53 family class IId bacteriocin n=1 Tax=Isoptericola sp. G70 TaxID=3376633 RepID=UPI003A80BDF6